jgi:hypothetical protein
MLWFESVYYWFLVGGVEGRALGVRQELDWTKIKKGTNNSTPPPPPTSSRSFPSSNTASLHRKAGAAAILKRVPGPSDNRPRTIQILVPAPVFLFINQTNLDKTSRQPVAGLISCSCCCCFLSAPVRLTVAREFLSIGKVADLLGNKSQRSGPFSFLCFFFIFSRAVSLSI